MKKLLSVLLLFGVIFSQAVFAASATYKSGLYTDRYVISDPGNASGYDGKIVYFLFRENDVIIEDPITHATYTENLLCWGNDTEATPCPGDPDGQGGIYSPLIYFIDTEIFATSNYTWEGFTMTVAEEKMFFVTYWNELYVKVAIAEALNAMNSLTGGDALNDIQKSRALKYIYFSQGIDLVTAELAADAYVFANHVPAYTELNLTNLPIQCQSFIFKVDEFGWLYWTQRDTWSDIVY